MKTALVFTVILVVGFVLYGLSTRSPQQAPANVATDHEVAAEKKTPPETLREINDRVADSSLLQEVAREEGRKFRTSGLVPPASIYPDQPKLREAFMAGYTGKD